MLNSIGFRNRTIGCLLSLAILSQGCTKSAKEDASSTSGGQSAAKTSASSMTKAEERGDYLKESEGKDDSYGRAKKVRSAGDKGTVHLESAPVGAFASAVAPPPGYHGGLGGSGLQNNFGSRANPTTVSPFIPQMKLDPNARYATTYRPGNAALASLDAAISRGAIPTDYQDLAKDFGTRYAPEMTSPQKEAMAFLVETERQALLSTGAKTHLRVSFRSSDIMPVRAPLSVHLVLDVSGSMNHGNAIDNARKAAEALVKKLDDRDTFSLVTFSSSAQVLVKAGPVGSRREQIQTTIRGVVAEGGTNISAGLDLGYQQAFAASNTDSPVKIVMFLSDGYANYGDTNKSSLAQRASRAFQEGVQTSSFGLGADYDAQLMSGIADQGAGAYYYLSDSSQIEKALTHEFESRIVPVAQAVEVRVRLRPDVSALRVYGSHVLSAQEAAQVRTQEVAVDMQVAARDKIKTDRTEDSHGGMRFFMPSFSRNDRHSLVMEVQVPQGAGERSLASVEIRYKDRITKKNVTVELPVKVKYVNSEEDSAKSVNASVARTVQAFAMGDTIWQAAANIDVGNRPQAVAILKERIEILKIAAQKLEEPKFSEDASRLERLMEAISGKKQVNDALPLAVLLRGVGYGYLH